MNKDGINYKQLVDISMRNVVKEIMRQVEKNGMVGDQHYYITFQTRFPGVSLSQDMRDKYPHDITIVLQHQFWNFKVEELAFSVDLSFNNVPQTIVVPFAAITALVDPSESFSIQLEHLSYDIIAPYAEMAATTPVAPVEEAEEENNVVALDSFRKKTENNE